jgi:hypothetical protein
MKKTLFNALLLLILALSVLIACGKEDMPVQDQNAQLLGSQQNINLEGRWECTESNKADYLPRGLVMTISNKNYHLYVTEVVLSSTLIKTGQVVQNGDKVKFGSGPDLTLIIINSNQIRLKYNTYYSFTFVRK